jgi:hypothetical protein
MYVNEISNPSFQLWSYTPSVPCPPSEFTSIHLCLLLICSILIFLGSVTCPSWRHPPILFLVFLLVLYYEISQLEPLLCILKCAIISKVLWCRNFSSHYDDSVSLFRYLPPPLWTTPCIIYTYLLCCSLQQIQNIQDNPNKQVTYQNCT